MEVAAVGLGRLLVVVDVIAQHQGHKEPRDDDVAEACKGGEAGKRVMQMWGAKEGIGGWKAQEGKGGGEEGVGWREMM